MLPAASSNTRYLAVAAALAAPFYLNDFASIFVTDWRWWLAIDYAAVKLLPLALVTWLLITRRMRPTEFGLTAQRAGPFLAVLAGAAIVGTLIDQNGYRLVAALPGYPALGRMPEIGSSTWNSLDLTAGLLLVGIVEELVFRAYACSVIERYHRSGATIIVVSAIAFGFAHWSAGLHAVVVTAAIGAVFMAIYLVTRSAPALMLAHFIVNVIDYAGIVPKSAFRLFPG